MLHTQGALKNNCSVLVVSCGRENEHRPTQDGTQRFPYPEIVSAGRLEVQTLKNPTTDEFCKVLDSWQPNFVFLRGDHLPNDEVGPIVWEGFDLSSREALSELFGFTLPTCVYLETPHGSDLAEFLHFKGIPYVIYWKNTFSCFEASHFCHALLSVIQSSSCHSWDAFQLAEASFRLHCLRDKLFLSYSSQIVVSDVGPNLLGEAPKINIDFPEISPVDDGESSSGSLPAVKIYDDDIYTRFLVCGVTKSLDAHILGALEDGLNALLNIEIRGSKLHNRVSALPPPLQAGSFSRAVVTMRCDLSTCSSTHISLLVSGSAQTCFDDQQLESHIKSEIIDNSHLVHPSPNCKPLVSEPRRSASVACGAAVFEVCMKVPTWASQVLRQLAHEVSYRTLVALGIAGIQGLAVAPFEKEDAERILFFSAGQGKGSGSNNLIIFGPPSLLRAPVPSRKRASIFQGTGSASPSALATKYQDADNKESRLCVGIRSPLIAPRQKIIVAALRPVPHVRHKKMLTFSGIPITDLSEGSQVKPNLPIAPTKHTSTGAFPAAHRKSTSSTNQAKQLISLNPLPLKKHGCGRSPMHVCSEEEFLADVMQFLIVRGHNRLIPQGGITEFPDAVLNAKRLDLFNLYREVVTRGGFHVGNGINWKGQVFSKMRNHTMTNRMTGVGNTLKRHYETYLLEYELAHDDVDGEYCLLCNSSEPGDWVNCGMCGEWAHFGCDRRPGLGAFKDYAKTDGLEYVCPQCSVSNHKKKMHKSGNEYS